MVIGFRFVVEGVDVLTPTGWVKNACVVIENGKFLSIDTSCTQRLSTTVAKGLLMLSGIVDMHGDSFERAMPSASFAIAPRPGVRFPLDMAILKNDA
ncbi:MAG: hypothetical protein AAGE96_21475 [Cyanobacteria bacterium P01_G01_bin.19]